MFKTTTGFTANSVFTLAAEVIRRKNANGSIVVMSMADEDRFYKVTGVAAEVFERLDGVTPLGEVIRQTQSAYDVTEERIYQDCGVFLEKLVELKLASFA